MLLLLLLQPDFQTLLVLFLLLWLMLADVASRGAVQRVVGVREVSPVSQESLPAESPGPVARAGPRPAL